MNKVLIIFTSLIFFVNWSMQNVQYACRFRNVSVFSETDSIYLINFRIYQDKLDHKYEASCNLTKDVHVKSITVVFHRCSYMNSACEDFQKWNFSTKLKETVYMKNQMWTPLVQHITPRLDFPNLKKNIYKSPDVSINTKAAVSFYPEVLNPNYFWRLAAILNDYNGKKAVVLNLELTIQEFVEKNKDQRRRGGKHN